MKNINLTIDDRPITAREGDILLWVALENNIYIPNLYAIKEKERPSASCRLCFVEIEGYDRPVTSCTQRVKEGMVVRTRTPAVDRLVRTAFELLLSDHDLNCAKCPARKNCALMTIARERKLKMKLTRLKPLNRERAIDDSTSLFTFDRNRCVLCGRCVWADREEARVGAIGFSNRGLERVVTTFRNIPLADSPCTECGLCVEACPVGTMTFK